jgi:hypothetical protein
LSGRPALDRNPELAPARGRERAAGRRQRRGPARSASGRSELYWLRLRAFCQAQDGQGRPAQLTFDLAQGQARDPVYGRLMAAKLAGTAPGAASLRGGLDYALSRALKLDLAAAKPAPAVAAAISGGEPPPPTFDVGAIDGAIGGLGTALTSGPPPAAAVSALIAAAAEADAKTRARLQAAALLVAALTPTLSGADRTKLAGFAIPDGKGPVGRSLALDAAAESHRMGEAALLALWTCADAGAAGPVLGDRVRIVRALARVGLMAEARAFVLEGLAGLK